jgi:hypothetical protein
MLDAVADYFGIEPRRDNELRARVHGPLDGIDIEDSAGSDEEMRLLCHRADRLGGRRGAKRHLGDGESSFGQRFAERTGAGRIFEGNYRDNFEFAEPLNYISHFRLR